MCPIFLLGLLVVAFFSCTESYQPLCTIFPGAGGAGCQGSGMPVNRVEDVRLIPGWTSADSSVRFQGTYLFYLHPNFNPTGQGEMSLITFEENNGQCHQVLNVYRSLRLVGSPNDCNIPSITFYDQVYFGDATEEVLADVPELTNPVKSLIMAGNSNWTVYTDANYGGEPFCIQTSAVDCSFRFSTNIHDDDAFDDLPLDVTFRSTRIGCFSKKIVKLESGTTLPTSRPIHTDSKTKTS